MIVAQLSALLMLFSTGLWAGVILAFGVERTNLWARMPVQQYAVDFRRSLFRVDPMQPILAVISLIAAVVFVWKGDGLHLLPAWLGIGMIAIVIVASIVIAEPINSKFRRIPEGQLPDRVEHYRTVWRQFHAARTVVALAAFACIVAAAVR